MHAANHGAAEQQELHVLVRGAARIEQVALGGIAHRPVDVLSGAVDAFEGLFVQQAGHTVLTGRVFEQRHGELLVVGGHVGRLEERRDLELAWGHFVVAGLCGNAQGVHLALHVLHEDLDPLGDCPEVVVVELLALGRGMAEQGAAGEQEVGAQGNEAAIHQEILLLRTTTGIDRSHLLAAEQFEQPLGLAVHGRIGAQQGCLLVEGFAGPGNKDSGNAEGDPVGGFHQEGWAGDVPGGVAPGLKGGANAAVREGGAIGLPLHQHLAGEFGDGGTIPLHGDEAVVLLCGGVGEGVENVGVVKGSPAGGPLLHGLGHHIGHGAVELSALLNRLLDRLENVLGQGRLHLGQVKHVLGPEFLEGGGGTRGRGRAPLDRLEGGETLGTGHRILVFIHHPWW